MKLTNSQQRAIEQQKRIFRLVHPNAEFKVWQPNGTTRLIAIWTIKNVLGNEIEQSKSWTIGKRGKIESRAIAKDKK